MHHRPDLDLMLLLVALRQSDIAQILQTLRGGVGQIQKPSSGKHRHFDNHLLGPIASRRLDHPVRKDRLHGQRSRQFVAFTGQV
jgi:hypothetical protein